ncbi:MAG: hypothetical protein ACOCYW_02075 [Roseicyclus sp.]
MSVTRDIVATWKGPRRVMRRLLDQGRREDRAVVILLGACFMIFVAQWPRLQRDALVAPEGAAPLEAQLGITFFVMMMIWPFLAYLVAALTHLVARALGGRGSWYSARLALFWALLASSPAWLFHGLVAGFIGPGPAERWVGAGLLLAFGTIWGMSLWEAESEAEAEAAA